MLSWRLCVATGDITYLDRAPWWRDLCFSTWRGQGRPLVGFGSHRKSLPRQLGLTPSWRRASPRARQSHHVVAHDAEIMSRPGAGAAYEAARLRFELGAAVRNRREELGLTQAELAERAGLK